MAKKRYEEPKLSLNDYTPPIAPDVETAVLGAMLTAPYVVESCIEDLTTSSFYFPKHQLIFETISELYKENSAINVVEVSERLKKQGKLEEAGNEQKLKELAEQTGAASHIEYYIKILKQYAMQRDLIKVSQEIIRQCQNPMTYMENLADDIDNKLDEIIGDVRKGNAIEVGKLIQTSMNRLTELQANNEMPGIPSGIKYLDRVIQGWQRTTLNVIGGDTSVGKTTFALNAARHAAIDRNIPVAIFSLGLSADRISNRLITTESGLSIEKIQGGKKLEHFEWEQLEYTLKRLRKAPIYIDDTPDLSIFEFQIKARALKRKKGVQLIIVDNIQLMNGPRELKDNRIQETAAIVRALKTTAKKLDVAVIAISQLSRDLPKTNNYLPKPQLYDLRDSGTIGNVADTVIFIHRPETFYHSEYPSDKEKAWFIIAKNSDGQPCEFEMKFKANQLKFVEPDQSLDIQPHKPNFDDANEPF